VSELYIYQNARCNDKNIEVLLELATCLFRTTVRIYI